MSIESRPKSRLFVEGKNDVHVVAQIARKLDPQAPWWQKDLIRDSGNDENARKDFMLAIKDPGRFGLILDADATDGKRVADRWSSLASLKKLGLPDQPPSDGWVKEVAEGLRVGVWLMPDNENEGAIESFLSGLVPEGSSWTYAKEVVNVARRDHGAEFADRHTAKAHLHTWLAWREEPGRPYGRAIEAGDLDVTRTDLPRRFVAWMTRLYGG